MLKFGLIFPWSLFLRVQLTIFQHWFRLWLGADKAKSHYLSQWCFDYRRIYASLGLNELSLLIHTSNYSSMSFMNDAFSQSQCNSAFPDQWNHHQVALYRNITNHTRDHTCAMAVELHQILGLYLLSGKTFYPQISWNLEAASLDVVVIISLWNLTGISAAPLPRCLSNCRATEKV